MGPYSCLLSIAILVRLFQKIHAADGLGCSSPKLPRHLKIVQIAESIDVEPSYPEGTVVSFDCDAGYTLFGSENTTCLKGGWLDYDAECLLEVAEGSRCHMSSQADEFASAQLAADGNSQTCVSFSPNRSRLLWSVDTIQAFRVRAVTILTQYSLPNSTVEIRVGSHHPSTGASFNRLCTRQKVNSLDGNRRSFKCEDDGAVGRYVSITIVEPRDHHVSFCEVNVYSDSGLSIDDACPPKSLSVSEAARYVFENQCIQFLGQNNFVKASRLCEQHSGKLVTPTSRAFQNFIDSRMLRFFENSFEQVVVSFWLNARRANESERWVDGNGAEIRGVQIEDEPDETCLVSESRHWHSESCSHQHQVVCISAPITCGSSGLPAHSSIQQKTKIPVEGTLFFKCASGFRADLDSITCFPNGSLSAEPSCQPGATEGLHLLSKIASSLRRLFPMLGELSTWAFNLVLAALSGLLVVLMSAISTCCFCMSKRVKARQISRKIQLSLISFSVPMTDLPINTSDGLFEAPSEHEKPSTISRF